MAWRRSVVYAAVLDDESLQFHYSPRPAIDAAWLHKQGAKRMIPLHPPLPPAWADAARRHLQAQADVAFREEREIREREIREREIAARENREQANGPRAIGEPEKGARTRLRWVAALSDRLLRDSVVHRRGATIHRPGATVRRFAARTRRAIGMVGYRWSAHVQDMIPLHNVSPMRRTQGDRAPHGFAMSQELLKWPAAEDLDAVAELLDGRLLGELEALQLAERAGIELHSSIEDCLAALTLTGRIQRRPGLQRTSFGEWVCLRCGATEGLVPWDCAACGETECWMCEECQVLGVVRGCTLLYAGRASTDEAAVGVSNGPSRSLVERRVAKSGTVETPLRVVRPPMTPVPFESHELTPAQARAANALQNFVIADRSEAAAGLAPEADSEASSTAAAGADSEMEREAIPEALPREALVWAVCGAGKTEICFPAVARVLGEGGRVLFAIPRRDVVVELGQRLRSAFPGIEMQVLHGGSGRTELWTLGQGSLTVATTHQVLRFERAFDLVVLDEVDAFPYRGSRMLQKAVENAVRAEGLVVRMSATPDRHLLKRADSGESMLITVPVRHHGQPLPVPVLQRDATLTRREGPFRPSELLYSAIERSLTADKPTRVLVFVPDVASTERVGRALAAGLARRVGRAMPGRIPRHRLGAAAQSGPGRRLTVDQSAVDQLAGAGRIGGALTRRFAGDVASGEGGTGRVRVLWSHARDPERQTKIRALQRGECEVFVATSILERGITVPDVDVIVLFADSERVFSESALVQMAGRVGRTVERPTGRVHFIGGRISPVMRRAVQQIERLNDEAAQLGLLRVDSEEHSERIVRSLSLRGAVD